jgi:hypothetical protein
MKRKPLEIKTEYDSSIALLNSTHGKSQNRSYIRFDVAQGKMCDFLDNNAATRKFFRMVLRRMESDARRKT